VELDALEALHPGELAALLGAELDRYFSHELGGRVRAARVEFQQDLQKRRSAILDEYEEEIAELQQEHEQYRADNVKWAEDFTNRIKELWHAIAGEMRDSAPDLVDFPIPEAEYAVERDGTLFNSQWNYMDQIAVYKKFQGKLNTNHRKIPR
jgi:hypothetical protein